MPRLGVNIDHVATLRQQRREEEPDLITAAKICESAGADSIVCHLREDRRHIQDRDVKTLRRTVRTRLNLEMAMHDEIIAIAGRIRPDEATIVPERRQELTTEGGLDVKKHFRRVCEVSRFLQKRGIAVSLFINPDPHQIQKAAESGVKMVELHTGRYAEAKTKAATRRELDRLIRMTTLAKAQGLIVNAGHGLKYHNTRPVAHIPGMEELNIGHSIISRAIFVGLKQAVQEMKNLVR